MCQGLPRIPVEYPGEGLIVLWSGIHWEFCFFIAQASALSPPYFHPPIPKLPGCACQVCLAQKNTDFTRILLIAAPDRVVKTDKNIENNLIFFPLAPSLDFPGVPQFAMCQCGRRALGISEPLAEVTREKKSCRDPSAHPNSTIYF